MTDKTDSKEREAFKAAHRHLELDEVPDAWGRPVFKHSHVEASWLGWVARAARSSENGRPTPQGNELLTVAERNIRSFLRSATFKSESDREAALSCVDVLRDAACASLTVSAGSGPLMGQPQEMPDLSALTERGAKAWAGVDAQGLRDSAASAGSEPVAWVDERALSWLANSRSLSATITTKLERGKSFERPMPLYLHPSPPEGMVGGWQDITTAPKDGTYLLLWEQYSTNPFVGCWAFGSWSVSHEHVDAEGGWDGANVVDSISQDRITHWIPLPPSPTSSADSGKGE
ncbi:hypothetical protein ACOYR4_13165 [Acidovorax sp. M14]|uniref:hypothetical protein n=1 Tax=Acidovorax sp. M14 TaxID=3411354 RepID=UPI003BF56252